MTPGGGGGGRRLLPSSQRRRAELGGARHRGRVHLAGGGGDQHEVGVRERVPARERLAERRLGEGDGAPDRGGVGGHAHRQRAVEGERLGPAQRLQAQRECAALDLLAEDVLLLAAAKGREALRAGELPREDRPPLDRAGRVREHLQQALGHEVGHGAGEIEVEGARGAAHRAQ